MARFPDSVYAWSIYRKVWEPVDPLTRFPDLDIIPCPLFRSWSIRHGSPTWLQPSPPLSRSRLPWSFPAEKMERPTAFQHRREAWVGADGVILPQYRRGALRAPGYPTGFKPGSPSKAANRLTLPRAPAPRPRSSRAPYPEPLARSRRAWALRRNRA